MCKREAVENYTKLSFSNIQFPALNEDLENVPAGWKNGVFICVTGRESLLPWVKGVINGVNSE